MPNSKQPPEDPTSQFSDEEKEQIQRYGQAMMHPPSDFDEEVEKELAKHYPHEAGFQKMKAAQTGGGSEDVGLGPTPIAQAQVKGRAAASQRQTMQAAQAAQAAQAQEQGQTPPPAPSGPAGVTQPYPAQAGPQPPAKTPQPAPPPPVPEASPEGPEEAE
jgi:hypothetical protein